MFVHIALLTLHITSAAMLFGAPLGVIRGCKRGLEISPAAFRMATDEAAKRSKLNLIGSIVTLVTGLALIFNTYGGFSSLPKNYHIALTLMLVSMIFARFAIRGAVVNLGKIASGETVDKEDALKAIKRLSKMSMVNHPLWFAILVLMVWRF